MTSNWAKRELLNNYTCDENKIIIAPFGPNVDISHDEKYVNDVINSKSFDKVKLLFLGAFWERKGGDFAVEVARKINAKGYNCELNVVGIPIDELKSDNVIKNHGYLKKQIPEEKEKFIKLIEECHFLVLPTRADTFGAVFCEANAFGLPAIASKVGGVPEVILDNKNGFTFDFPIDINAASEKIIELYTNRQQYLDLCQSSYNEYLLRLNWDFAIKIFIKEISEIIKKLETNN